MENEKCGSQPRRVLVLLAAAATRERAAKRAPDNALV